MSGGFSFCGIDCGDLGLEYAPSMQDMYVFREGTYGVHEEAFDAHHGGFYYGNTVKPKDFTLRCIFQDTEVLEGIISRCMRFFRRGRTGKLVFNKRPWLWYVATVVSIDVTQFTNHYNGFFTINMRAYYPFARHRDAFLPDDPSDDMLENSGLIGEDYMPFTDILNNRRVQDVLEHCRDGTMINGNTITNLHLVNGITYNLLLYNGGTERAPVAIEIAGDVGDGISIHNKTTGQTCSIIALTKALTTSKNKYLVCDALTGKTVLTNGETSELGFMYHHEGFIELEPSFPIWRNQPMTMVGGSRNMIWWEKYVPVEGDRHTADEDKSERKGFANDEYIGKFINVHREPRTTYAGPYLNENWDTNAKGGYWIPVTNVIDGSTLEVVPRTKVDGEPLFANTYEQDDRNIVTMNEIEITVRKTADLTRLRFVYRPTFW